MDMIELITTGVIQGFGMIAHREHGVSKTTDLNVADVTACIKHVLKSEVDEIYDEWKAMLDAFPADGVGLSGAVNLQMNVYSRKAWNLYDGGCTCDPETQYGISDQQVCEFCRATNPEKEVPF